MFPKKYILAVTAILTLTEICASIEISSLADLEDIRVICYYATWSASRTGVGKFTPQNINPYLCTHIIYAYGSITKDITIKPFNEILDIKQGGYAKFTGLKAYNKDLKTMLGLGGWNERSVRFASIAADPSKRSVFIKNLIEYLRLYNFDGMNLDWQFPFLKDRRSFSALIQELREGLEKESKDTNRPRLLLTITLPTLKDHISRGYDVPHLTKYVDWMNVLSYNYHTAMEPVTNHHSQLYGVDEAFDYELNTNFTINSYLESGAERDKLVLGIPTFGRAYTLTNATMTDIRSPAAGPGLKSEQTGESGFLAYYEICKKVKDDGWIVERPYPNAMGPYAYKDNQWVNYDDEIIVRKKSQYVGDNKLGGIFFWLMEYDDFRGYCNGKQFPLIEAAKEALLTSSGYIVDNIISDPKKSEDKISKQRPTVRIAPTSNEDTQHLNVTNPQIGMKIKSRKARTTSKLPLKVQYTTPEPPPTPTYELRSAVDKIFSEDNEEGYNNSGEFNDEDNEEIPVDELRIICYYGSWAAAKRGIGRFTPEDIDPFLCTHILYAFGRLTKRFTFEPANKIIDIDQGGYAKFTGLKKINKNLKPMLSLQIQNGDSVKFASVAANSTRRSIFIQNSIKYLRQHNFDGLEFHWQYPNLKDRRSYSSLIKELREGYEKESSETGLPRLLLALTLPTSTDHVNRGYDIPLLTKYVDCMHPLTYNYHDEFEPIVNHHSQLYSVDNKEYSDFEVNTNYTMTFYLESGAERPKLAIGVPTFGRGYTLSDSNFTDIGSPADGPGLKGDLTNENGVLAYSEICNKIKNEGWSVRYPYPDAMGPYAFKGRQWVGYDDEDIMRKKGEYVAKSRFGGIVFWLMEYDDFHGYCGGKPFPLIKAAKEGLISTARAYNAEIARSHPNIAKTRPLSRRPKKQETAFTTMMPWGIQEAIQEPSPILPFDEMSSVTNVINPAFLPSSTQRVLSRSVPNLRPTQFNEEKYPDEIVLFGTDNEKYFEDAKNLKQLKNFLEGPGGIERLRKILNIENTTPTSEFKPLPTFRTNSQHDLSDDRINDNKQTRQTHKEESVPDLRDGASKLFDAEEFKKSKILNIVFRINL